MSENYNNEGPRNLPAATAPPPGWYAMPQEGWSEDAEPEIDVMEYARLLWAKKWLIVAVLVATVIFATAWSMTRTKMYRATTKLILQPAPQMSQNQFDMMMSWWQMDRFIADQIEVLKTRQLAQRQVRSAFGRYRSSRVPMRFRWSWGWSLRSRLKSPSSSRSPW